MYSFDGDFKTKPEQNLSGATRESREQFLQRAQRERQRREDTRLRSKNVVTIQSYVRSYLIRTKIKNSYRSIYDQELPNCSNSDQLTSLISQFLFFYNRKLDQIRLINLCNKMLTIHHQVIYMNQTSIRFHQLLRRTLLICVQNNHTEILNCLLFLMTRMDIDYQRTMWFYLIENGMFTYLRQYGDREKSATMLFLHLICRPVSLAFDCTNATNRKILANYTRNMLSVKITPFFSEHFLFVMKQNSNFSFSNFIALIRNDVDSAFYTNDLIYYLFELENEEFRDYSDFLHIISHFQIRGLKNKPRMFDSDSSEDSDEVISDQTLLAILRHLNNDFRCDKILDFLKSNLNDENISYVLIISQKLFLIPPNKIGHAYNFPLKMSLCEELIFRVWQHLKLNMNRVIEDINSINNSLTDTLRKLNSFCNIFHFFVLDFTFVDSCYNESKFNQQELFLMSAAMKDVCLHFIELAFPLYYKHIEFHEITYEKLSLYTTCMIICRKLYNWNLRLNFCPSKFWISNEIPVSKDFMKIDYLSRKLLPFFGLVEVDGNFMPPLTVMEKRTLAILQEIPFIINFNTRVSLLMKLCSTVSELPRSHFNFTDSTVITIRRSHLYEDAFNKLYADNDVQLRRNIRVKFINQAGLEEAGIDGGGIFKEFLNELMKTAFDPNRGFFLLTNENTLYPNPNIHLIMENYDDHFNFIGRMIGKAILEGIILDLPLAEFFLAKVCNERIERYHLSTLDPILFKNLMYLNNYAGDVEKDLDLDFSVASNDLGETKMIELKPNGNSIPVTNSNRKEYINLLADLKLNKQLSRQCATFAYGLDTVVPLYWLKIFDHKELQVLISGDDTLMDLLDLVENTNYAGEFSLGHPTIILFWKIMHSFSENQKKRLLKFVTCCSRSPLLGFKELNPPFCIQSVEDENRMPTASTCLNLLKLPIISDEEVLRNKLLSAIEQTAGFELS